MKSPVSIWVVSLLLGSYGIYLLWAATDSINWMSLAVGLMGALALVGCGALLLRKRWSQYFVYAFALVLVGIWVQEFARAIVGERWPYDGHLNSSISLLPGVVLVLVCVAASIATFLYFRSSPSRT